MYAKINGATIDGLQGYIVTVEVDISAGLPSLDIVGLPNQSVKESRERVKAAIRNSGFEFPMRRIVVNLAPADLRKQSSGLDLAIAIGILEASGQIKLRKPKRNQLLAKRTRCSPINSRSVCCWALPIAYRCCCSIRSIVRAKSAISSR